MILKGTIKEIIMQINGLIAYYDKNATIKEIIEKEYKGE